MNALSLFLYLYGVLVIIIAILIEYKLISNIDLYLNYYKLSLPSIAAFQVTIILCFLFGFLVIVFCKKCDSI